MRAKKYDDVTFDKQELINYAYESMLSVQRCIDLNMWESAVYYRHRAIFWEQILSGYLNLDEDDWIGPKYREMVTLYDIEFRKRQRRG